MAFYKIPQVYNYCYNYSADEAYEDIPLDDTINANLTKDASSSSKQILTHYCYPFTVI